MGLSTDLDRAPRVHASMPGLDFAISPSKGTGEVNSSHKRCKKLGFHIANQPDTLQKIKFFAGERRYSH